MQLNEHPTVKRYQEKAAAQPPPLNWEKIDADRLKSLALEAGADDAAIVELDRPGINDQRADILEIFPRTKSLVSLVCKMNRENIRCPSRDVSDLEFLRTFGRQAGSERHPGPLPFGRVSHEHGQEESIYVVPGSDAEQYVAKRFPHKKVRLIGNGLRAGSAKSFLESLHLIFQRGQSEGLNATYHFTFTGDEQLTGTAVIKDKQISVLPGHVGKADLHLTADSRTWVNFLAKEKGLLPALIQRKIRIKGSPRLMKRFARCFPS